MLTLFECQINVIIFNGRWGTALIPFMITIAGTIFANRRVTLCWAKIDWWGDLSLVMIWRIPRTIILLAIKFAKAARKIKIANEMSISNQGYWLNSLLISLIKLK